MYVCVCVYVCFKCMFQMWQSTKINKCKEFKWSDEPGFLFTLKQVVN